MQARSILDPLYDGIAQLDRWLGDENKEVEEVATVALEAQMLGERIVQLSEETRDLFFGLLDEAEAEAVRVKNEPIRAEARTWLLAQGVPAFQEDLDDAALIRAMNHYHPDGWIGFHQERFNK